MLLEMLPCQEMITIFSCKKQPLESSTQQVGVAYVVSESHAAPCKLRRIKHKLGAVSVICLRLKSAFYDPW